jgi:hypothetical protein
MRFFSFAFVALLSVVPHIGCSSAAYQGGVEADLLHELAQKAVELTVLEGGATLRVDGKNLAGEKLYAVGAYPELTEKVAGYPEPAEVYEFVSKHFELLRAPENCLGTWFDQGALETSLDISVAVPDLMRAKQLARAGRQKAIYDLFQKREIRLEEAAVRRRAVRKHEKSLPIPAEPGAYGSGLRSMP